MERLIQGVLKFQRDVYPKERHLFEELVTAGQSPRTLFITCSDSRIVPQLITQSQPGDLFIIRNAGNMVPAYGECHGGVSATIEYAVSALNVKDIIVCGHTDCGAMKGVLNPESVRELPAVRTWLNHGEPARQVVLENYKHLPEDARLHLLVEENVVAQLDHLKTHPSVAARLARGAINLYGWVYDLRTGGVQIWDAQRARFIPIDQYNVSGSSTRPRIQPFSDVSDVDVKV